RLGSLLLRKLLAPRPHRIRLNAHRLSDGRTEAIRLDQDGRQTANVVNTGADAEVVQHLAAGPAHLQLEVGQAQLLADYLGVFLHLVADLAHRRVKAQSALD